MREERDEMIECSLPVSRVGSNGNEITAMETAPAAAGGQGAAADGGTIAVQDGNTTLDREDQLQKWRQRFVEQTGALRTVSSAVIDYWMREPVLTGHQRRVEWPL